MNIEKLIRNRENYSLDETRKIASLVETFLLKLPFLSKGLRRKIKFYKERLDSCETEHELYLLSQELRTDLNNLEKGSLGQLTKDASKNWGARIALKKFGLQKNEDPMPFIRNRVFKILEGMGHFQETC